MSTSGTSAPARRARSAGRLALVLLACTPWAAGAGADELLWSGEAELTGRLYRYERPFRNDDLTSYFDRYTTVLTRDADVPWFVDLSHLDLGLQREDGTWLLRGERWNPHWQNDRGLLTLDWRGLDARVEGHHFRTDFLRLFPRGTRQTLDSTEVSIVPVFGSFYNADGTPYEPDGSFYVPPPPPPGFNSAPPPITAPGNPLGRDRRFWVRRSGVDGELRLRLEPFGLANPLLDEVELFGGFERRRGFRQQRFLLDSVQEPALRPTSRWRGLRRELEHEVARVGGGFVISPWDLFTGAFRASYERFHVRERQLVFDDLVERDSTLSSAISFLQENRSIFYLPETKRVTGSFTLGTRLLGADVHLGAHYSKLSQAGQRSPLQRIHDLGDSQVTSYALKGAFDAPLGLGFGVNGFWKWLQRRSDIDEDAFDLVSADQTQVGVYTKKRSESRGGLELTYRPVAGSLVGLGFEQHRIDRTLSYNPRLRQISPELLELPAALPLPFLRPELAFHREDNESHTGYLRMRTRLMRSLQLSAELSYESVSDVAYPRDLESVFRAEGRGSWTWVRWLPFTISAFAKFHSGESDDVVVFGRRNSPVPAGRDPLAGLRIAKRFDRTGHEWGGSLTALPFEPLVVFASFVSQFDRQKFSYVRSTAPRFATSPDVLFFLDSVPTMETRLQTLVAGARLQVTPRLEASGSATFTWTHLDFPGTGADARSARILEEVNEVRTRITSVEGRVGYRFLDWLRGEIGYRLDDYHDERNPIDPIDLESRVHTYSVSIRIDFDRLLRPGRQAP